MSDLDALLKKYGQQPPAPASPAPTPPPIVAKPVPPITPFPPVVPAPKKKPSLVSRVSAWFTRPLL